MTSRIDMSMHCCRTNNLVSIISESPASVTTIACRIYLHQEKRKKHNHLSLRLKNKERNFEQHNFKRN